MPGYVPDELLNLLTPHFAGRSAYLLYRDEKAAGVAGGNFVNGAWRTRDLTVEVHDTGNFGTLAANQITLDAGIYIIHASAPAHAVRGHHARWANITDTTYTYGTSDFAHDGNFGYSRSFVNDVFTITSSKVFELQHRCENTRNGDGFGYPVNIAVIEVYSEVYLEKIA